LCVASYPRMSDSSDSYDLWFEMKDKFDEMYGEVTTVDFLLELGEFGLRMKKEAGEGPPIQLWASLRDGTLLRKLGPEETARLHSIITGGKSYALDCVGAMMDGSTDLEEVLITGMAVSGIYTADVEFIYPPNVLMDSLVRWLAEREEESASVTSEDFYRLSTLYGR
jgi:hypothetical protein